METRQRRSFTDDYKRQAVDLVASRSMLRRTATCWPTSLSIVLPNVLLHEEQSTRRVVLRPPSALSKMCSGLVFSVNSFSQKMHLAISRLSKLSGWSFFWNWCGRPESNRHRPFGPTDFLTSYGFRRLAWARSRFGSFVVWTIPSPLRLRTVAFALGAARLVSTPSRVRGLGSGLPR
jgi:hypothetical protein